MTTTRDVVAGANDKQSQAVRRRRPVNPSNGNSPVSPLDDQGDQGGGPPQPGEEKPAFPHADLAKLDDTINRPDWEVPLLPMEDLLKASIDLSKKGLDIKFEACQMFFQDGLTTSFSKILTDDSINGWQLVDHKWILDNTHLLVELCVAKLSHDSFPLLKLLAMATDPDSEFHLFNKLRTCNSDKPFACSRDPREPKGWLVDLLNKFGMLNGFQMLHDRFTSGQALNIQIIAALLKPFGQCSKFLTLQTLKRYFLPIIEMVPQFLENLTDDELRKETQNNEAKNDALSVIIKCLRNLASQVPGQEATVKNLKMIRLNIIYRLLQISSFNGKMNALNEVNQVISSVNSSVCYDPQCYLNHNPEDDWLTAKDMTEWIQQNNILSIVLSDSLHQPQYVEKLENILRFIIEEKALTTQDLDNIWAAQAGKHEAIVKNVHNLLATLVWHFTPEQLDHLFDCFKASWTNASKKQHEKLLELIRRLAEHDRVGMMAHKVLDLLWNLAHSNDVPLDIMDQALSAHIRILESNLSSDKEIQKIQWLDRFIVKLHTTDKWVIPALKQIRAICSLFGESPQRFNPFQRSIFYRHDLINQLQNNHALVTLVAKNLSTYIQTVRQFSKAEQAEVDPHTVMAGSRYSHVQEVQGRLDFLSFLLKDGQLWLYAPEAKKIWKCLTENAVYFSDREACFKWYSKLMGDLPDLYTDITKDFFINNILQLDPSLLTENGMKCFERFFLSVNRMERKLVVKPDGAYLIDDLELIGLDYLWTVVIQVSDDFASRAIDLLKEIYTNLGPKLQVNQVEIHEHFIRSCFDRLKATYDTLCILDRDQDSTHKEATHMVRVLTVLMKYINKCDSDYHSERTILPMSRAFWGKDIKLYVRLPDQPVLQMWTQTNKTIGSVRRDVLAHIKANDTHSKIELIIGRESVSPADDRKLIGQLYFEGSKVTAKVTQVNASITSTTDSSFSGYPGKRYSDVPYPDVESSLPSVIMSLHLHYISFLWQVADLGCTLNMPLIRDCAQELMKLLPHDNTTVENLHAVCLDHAKLSEKSLIPTLDSCFFGNMPSKVLYLIEVVYALLMPASELGGDASNFQYNFLKSGGLPLVLSMFTRNSFPPSADMETQRGIYLNALKVAKLLLTAIGFVLQKALVNIPNPNSERRLREVASHLAKQISNDNFFQSSKYIPDICVIQTLQKIVWASGCGTLQLIFSSHEEISKIYEMMIVELDEEDEQVCFQALEVMNLFLAFMPTALDALSKEKSWQTFIIDMLLHCPSKSVRQMAQEQFFHMATSCGMGQSLLSFITLLFNVLGSSAKECGRRAGNYFILLQRLLKYACNYKINLPNAEVLLNDEIDWLKRIRDEVKRTGETGVEDTILEGHINVTKELLAFQTSEKKYNIGCENGANLIKDLIDDFIFPVSKDYLQYRNRNFHAEQAIPVCSSSASINAGFELLVALTIGCPRNLKQVAGALHNLECEELKEWEYLPPIGPRPNKGFVGLKNAGATCYMNSVIQQLFMIPPIRNGILALESTGTNVVNNTYDEAFGYHHKPSGKSEDRKRYNIDVLQHLQVIFGHLAASKQQYFVPADFLNHFRLWGERVNPKEQHDALEFFNSLVDSLDEALKAFGHPALLSQVMGGSFADQKICQGCPHRYECEESFTTLNVDVRNHQNLLDSMEQYVKGDLLEGANAYHCEKCDKKVDTVKRLLIKKLPPVLAIQLKRFDYDWERECAIKFNDYFEFPRELDMGPYTVTGVAELEENQVIQQNKSSEPTPPISSKYRLVGVLVHSGQASGGHYYSYITQRDGGECNRWYKFDDGNVTECKMDDEDMKDMCFGGSYMGILGEVCRWWSAYILFYERVDSLDVEMIKHIKELTLSSSKLHLVKMPYRIEYRVRKENGQFIHRQRQYSLEYFQFIKKLLTCNSVYLNPPTGKDILPEAEEIAMISVKLAARFLFSRGFRTKIVARHASEWYEWVLVPLLTHSKNVRYWFVENVLLNNSNLSEYLLECPSDDVREGFTKLIIYVAQISLDCPRSSLTTSPGPWAQGGNNLSLSDQLLTDVLNLLNKEGSEHGRHSRLFKLFEGYANRGLVEKEQLLKLSVPTRFMSMPYCQYQCAGRQYQCAGRYTVVSQLVRCCDVSSRTQSSESNPPLPNPYCNTNPAALLMPIQPKLAEMLFAGAVYVTKIIEGYRKMEGYGNSINSNEEMVKLLCFSCWENQQFSSTVLSVLLQKVAYIYSSSFELNLTNKMHLLLRILQIGDSWQSHRICDVLKGIPNDRHGLFDIIQLDKNLYKKQTYECIKHMVSLFDECDVAHQILKSNDDLKCKWKLAVEWLKGELETRPYTATSQCTYGDYYHSSDDNTLLLAKACKLCPEEEESDDLGSN